jgi:hypothetical protein
MASFRIAFDIANMRCEGRPCPLGIDRHLGADRPAGASGLDREFGQRQRIEAASIGASWIGATIAPIDRLGADSDLAYSCRMP